MGEIADALRQAEKNRPAEDVAPPPSPARSPSIDHEGRSNALPDRPTLHAESTASEEPIAPRQYTRPAPLKLAEQGDEKWRPARIALSESNGEAAQQYRRLAFRVRDRADTRLARSIIVTSAEMGDGKTTTACNLAIQLVKLDQALRVVLVDLDLRRASIAAAFGVQADSSVAEVLRGEQALGEAILETDIPGLSALILSQPVADPEWLLSNPNLRTMIQDLESRFDFVIIDTPPVLAVSDAQLILRHASAALFVARAGRTPVKAVRRALDHLPAKKLLGSFLNSSPRSDGTGGYAYYGDTASLTHAEDVAEIDVAMSSETAEDVSDVW